MLTNTPWTMTLGILLTLTLTQLTLTLAAGKVTFCYYSSFAQTRPAPGRFLPEDIDPQLCSHVIFAFVDIVGGRRLEPTNWNDVITGGKGLYDRTIALKEINPNLKVLLAVGGWAIGSRPFTSITARSENQRYFVQHLVHYLRKYGFDGLDMDWEFPGSRGSPPEDKYRFTNLIQDIQDAFHAESHRTGQEKLLLTLAAAAGSHFIEAAYEVKKIVHIVDYVLAMTYNYHGSWDDVTGHHSPMYAQSDDVGKDSQLNQMWTLDYYLSMGAPPHKLVVGIATYGMSFTLADRRQHGLRAPAVGGGDPGLYTGESGILAYYEICELLEEDNWHSVWVDEMKVPYAYSGHQWVGYDDINSITYKAKNILDMDLGGAFIWSVEMDDFSGHCSGERYPLLSTIARILRPDALGNHPSLNYVSLTYNGVEKTALKQDPFKHDTSTIDEMPLTVKPRRAEKTSSTRFWPLRKGLTVVKKRRKSKNQYNSQPEQKQGFEMSEVLKPESESYMQRSSFVPSDLEIVREVARLDKEMLPQRKLILGLLPEENELNLAYEEDTFHMRPDTENHHGMRTNTKYLQNSNHKQLQSFSLHKRESNADKPQYRRPEGRAFIVRNIPTIVELYPVSFPSRRSLVDIPVAVKKRAFLESGARKVQEEPMETFQLQQTSDADLDMVDDDDTQIQTKADLTCKSPGVRNDPASCSHYYVCVMDKGHWKRIRMSCRPGYGFHETQHACLRHYECK